MDRPQNVNAWNRRQTYTTFEVVEIFKLSDKTIHNRAERGELPPRIKTIDARPSLWSREVVWRYLGLAIPDWPLPGIGDFMGTKQIADLFGVSQNSISHQASTGAIPVSGRMGAQYLIPTSWIVEALGCSQIRLWPNREHDPAFSAIARTDVSAPTTARADRSQATDPGLDICPDCLREMIREEVTTALQLFFADPNGLSLPASVIRQIAVNGAQPERQPLPDEARR